MCAPFASTGAAWSGEDLQTRLCGCACRSVKQVTSSGNWCLHGSLPSRHGSARQAGKAPPGHRCTPRESSIEFLRVTSPRCRKHRPSRSHSSPFLHVESTLSGKIERNATNAQSCSPTDTIRTFPSPSLYRHLSSRFPYTCICQLAADRLPNKPYFVGLTQ